MHAADGRRVDAGALRKLQHRQHQCVELERAPGLEVLQHRGLVRADRTGAGDAPVDVDRFMGDWYVIANIPTFAEKGAHNAVESYRLDADGTIATTTTNYDNSRGKLNVSQSLMERINNVKDTGLVDEVVIEEYEVTMNPGELIPAGFPSSTLSPSTLGMTRTRRYVLFLK